MLVWIHPFLPCPRSHFGHCPADSGAFRRTAGSLDDGVDALGGGGGSPRARRTSPAAAQQRLLSHQGESTFHVHGLAQGLASIRVFPPAMGILNQFLFFDLHGSCPPTGRFKTVNAVKLYLFNDGCVICSHCLLSQKCKHCDSM